MCTFASMYGVFWLSRRRLYASVLVNCRSCPQYRKTEARVMRVNHIASVTLILLNLLGSVTASAQHGHGALTPGVTFPQDDAVLRDAPQMITMSFRVDVVLLKLALYNATDEWINIGFQYDPNRMSHSFVYPLPEALPPSEFYVARWSVTDASKRLVNGEFRFSFGPGAIPPSEVLAARVSTLKENLPDTGSYRIGTAAQPE